MKGGSLWGAQKGELVGMGPVLFSSLSFVVHDEQRGVFSDPCICILSFSFVLSSFPLIHARELEEWAVFDPCP